MVDVVSEARGHTGAGFAGGHSKDVIDELNG